MKRLILATILSLFTIGAFAQIQKDDLAIIQAQFHKTKTDIVKQQIKLSDEQGKVFWPLYDEYESKRQALNAQGVQIINDYLKSYSTLTDPEAVALVDRILANDNAFTELQKTYFKKFTDAIGGKSAAKFYQLENYLQQIIKLNIQHHLPFIDQLDKSRSTK